MENDKKIRDEVRRTLQSLDGIEPARAKADFYDRLRARLDEEVSKNYSKASGFMLAVAAVILLVLANIFTIRQYRQSYGDTYTVRQENLDDFAEDYQVQTPVIYELTTQE